MGYVVLSDTKATNPVSRAKERMQVDSNERTIFSLDVWTDESDTQSQELQEARK